ncbi:Outer membrane efflux protein [Candidatus Sulfopaludibacter sp. SbA3]|nr:Outer membrane efflux protein [Candidatus Sulfopaludibacter sp. SbA3]
MHRAKSVIAVLLSGALVLPVFAQTQSYTLEDGHGLVYSLTHPYRPHPVSQVSFDDSPRIEKLMRAGVIYLSLRDAIALALENNLDIESARYSPKLALADLQRASAGQLIRNISTNISQGPNSASLGVLSGATQVNSAGASSSSGGTGGVLSGFAGSSIPNTEPYFYIAGGFNHSTSIETSTQFTGTPFLVQQYKNLTYGVQQGFWTGTTVSMGLSSVFGYNQNATTALFNPINTGSLSLSITQNLLNGFGLAVNKRAYHKARNNLRSNDLTFQAQVIATVSNVVNLYYDLVTFNEDLRVSQETLRLDTQLYEDTKKRADLGALAPIDIIQSEADVKSAQQDVVQRESQLLQQEMILKSVLTRNGLDNSTIALARVVPTDHIDVPEQEPVIPIQDLVSDAMAHRIEIEQNQIALENARLDLLGTKNNLLPNLSFSANLSNAGQGGTLNPGVQVPVIGADGKTIVGYRPLGPQDVSSLIIGGYGTVLSQIFARNFPNYSFQLQLTVPIRNKANQADQITNELQYRQQQISDKQLHNNIKLAVMNDWTSQRNSRAAYDTAVAARKLADETLTGSRRKYELGSATILDVVIATRDDTARRLSEVDALNQLQHARTSLQRDLGKILDTYSVDLEGAMSGTVKRPADPIPVILQQPNGIPRDK